MSSGLPSGYDRRARRTGCGSARRELPLSLRRLSLRGPALLLKTVLGYAFWYTSPERCASTIPRGRVGHLPANRTGW